MLRVTLEMVPFGQEDKKRTLGKIDIANIGGTSVRAMYRVDAVPAEGRLLTFEIKNFDRSKRAWALVQKAIWKMRKYDL